MHVKFEKAPSQIYAAMICLILASNITTAKFFSDWHSIHFGDFSDSQLIACFTGLMVCVAIFAFFTLLRQNWARHALSVISIFFVAVGLSNGNFSELSGELLIAQFIAYAGVVLFLWKKQSREWFERNDSYV